MKKWHLFIIFLSEAAVYRNETRVDINASSVRVVKLYLENLMKNNNDEEFFIEDRILDNSRFECGMVTSSDITLSYGVYTFKVYEQILSFPTKIQPPISNDLRCQLYETHFEIDNSTITIPDVSIPKHQLCK